MRRLRWAFVVGIVACSATALAAVPKTDLFRAGEHGYTVFRIPALAATPRGTVLAFAEARRGRGMDWDANDLVLRRSEDGGRTFGPVQRIGVVPGLITKNPAALAVKGVDRNDVTYSNAVPIVERRSGAVVLLFCVEYMRCFVTRSDDDGRTFGTPKEITAALERFRRRYDWRVIATGPGHGLQMRGGRMVVPVWMSTATGPNAHHPSVSAVIYSDDGGLTWRPGDIVFPASDELVDPNETTIEELADGRVMLIARNQAAVHRKSVAYSREGATAWSQPAFHGELVEPICMGSLRRLSRAEDGPGGRDRLLWSGPQSLEPAPGKAATPGSWRPRRDLTLRLSYDEGRSFALARTLEEGPSGYSDLAALPDGTILLLYERWRSAGPAYEGYAVTLARVDLRWLTHGRDRLRPRPTRARVADVCVYGGTSGGVMAAIQAARMGKRAVIMEPTRHVGGMTASGLGALDVGKPETIGGLAHELLERLRARYGTGVIKAVEPHVAEAVMSEMLAEANVEVLFQERLASVRRSGAHLQALVSETGTTCHAKTFIDATYEGDLMAAAGVTYTLSREANERYGETLNGVQLWELPTPQWGTAGANGRRRDGRGLWDRAIPLDPYVRPGDARSGLLPGIEQGPLGRIGAAAPGVQAYGYRLCMTKNPTNRRPIEPPRGYDPAQYELHGRYIAACRAAGDHLDLRWFTKHDPLPNDKLDINTAYLGTNVPGLGLAYLNASPPERARIARLHEDHARGLFHFLATDPRVPEQLRAEARQLGLCADEFVDNDNWPYQLYVREGRRMVSAYVMTERHVRGVEVAPRPVALASYGIDVHEVRRIVHRGVMVREGKLLGHHPPTLGPYPVDYLSLVPRRSEADNLLVPFALSASHVAFASIRMEPVFMMLAQAAGTAAALSIEERVPVQAVTYQKLRTRLTADGQILTWPPAQAALPVEGMSASSTMR